MTAALEIVRSMVAVGERRSLITDLLPPDVPAPRFVRAVQAQLMRSPKLRNAEPESLQAAVVDAAALGIVVGDSLGQGFLVVDRENKARLLVGYRFVATAAHRLEMRVSSGNVREGDTFDFSRGDRFTLHHRPSLALPARRPVTAAWALASPLDRKGDPLGIVLSRAEILEIRANAPAIKANKQTPWREVDSIPFGKMAEKSAVRRLLPSLPLGAEAARAAGRALDDGDDLAASPADEPATDRTPESERAGGRGRNAVDVEAELVDRPAPGSFPHFDRLGEFATWSRSFLRRATPTDALAWLDTFGGRLDQAAATGRPDVVALIDELRHLAQARAAGA